jgi:hypothetical protein
VSYRPEPEGGEDDNLMLVKTFSSALLTGPIIGLFLLLTGLADGGYIRVTLGVLMLAVSPFIIRWVWRGGLWN